MDSQFVASREDLYEVQMEVKHVQAVQQNHSDRLSRLEKRQADDAALKSVWGTSSPFPSILSGTPQHGPVTNLSNDVFDDFEDGHGQSLLGSLQLETDEEPVRRGTSRANSVRFDVSALQGSNWAAGSRNSGEFGITRPNSGLGSHPMVERSLSYKSDGRHSSAGHSVHSMHSVPSGRTSSLGLNTNFVIGGQDEESLVEVSNPPPGLFILGTVPSIIRCWLTTNFSHSALLYADVCTGAQRSIIDYSLVKDLGLLDQMQKNMSGVHTIRLPVYLPEAIFMQPSLRSASPASQLPTLTAEFEISGFKEHNLCVRESCIRVFIGSDTLRAHNADVLFSQNLMTLYGGDRNKISVPFVRPEAESSFKNLCIAHISPEKNELKATALPFVPTKSATLMDPPSNSVGKVDSTDKSDLTYQEAELSPRGKSSQLADSIPNGKQSLPNLTVTATQTHPPVGTSVIEHGIPSPNSESNPESSQFRDSTTGIWGSWRHGSSLNSSESESTSGYQRPQRGVRSMKILKPSKQSTAINPSTTYAPQRSVSTSTSRAPLSSTHDSGPPVSSPRTSLENLSRRKSAAGSTSSATTTLSHEASGGSKWSEPRDKQQALGPEEYKGIAARKSLTNIMRISNPIGGATAFAWMAPPPSNSNSNATFSPNVVGGSGTGKQKVGVGGAGE